MAQTNSQIIAATATSVLFNIVMCRVATLQSARGWIHSYTDSLAAILHSSVTHPSGVCGLQYLVVPISDSDRFTS